MGLFTKMFGSSFSEDGDKATWEREAHLTIPDIDLDYISFEEYKTFKSAQKLALSFTYPGEGSKFLEEGKTYSEHLKECYQKDVLMRGLLRD